MSGLRIALSGKARSGKDTIADRLEWWTGAIKINISAGVYDACNSIQNIVGAKIEKDPRLLQGVGMLCRELYGPDVWIDCTVRKIDSLIIYNDPKVNIVISDVRFPNELEKLKSIGFTIVRIVRDNRPIDRDPNHISEIALDDYPFEHIIYNNGTLEELNYKVLEMVSKLSNKT